MVAGSALAIGLALASPALAADGSGKGKGRWSEPASSAQGRGPASAPNEAPGKPAPPRGGGGGVTGAGEDPTTSTTATTTTTTTTATPGTSGSGGEIGVQSTREIKGTTKSNSVAGMSSNGSAANNSSKAADAPATAPADPAPAPVAATESRVRNGASAPAAPEPEPEPEPEATQQALSAPAALPPAADSPTASDVPLVPFGTEEQGIAWSVIAAIVFAGVSGFALRHASLRGEIQSARQVATRDLLTGLANRRLFEETLAREVARQRRTAAPLALALIDLDHFKQVNDTRGHAGGDEVLRAAAIAIGARVRESDLPARIGGDEFAVLLPDCPVGELRRVGEVLRTRIEDAVGPMVTASIGVAVMPDHARDGDALLAAADEALYEAKANGRNQTVVASGEIDLVALDEDTRTS